MNDMTPEEHKETNRKKWLFLLGGIFLGGALATLCIFIIGITVFLIRSPLSEKIGDKPPDAVVQLIVGKDGCEVERTDPAGSTAVTSLTWVVIDPDGNTVLERNAEDEYRYRYYRGGQYRVHVKAWYGGRYHKISDEVTIQCQ